MSSNSSTLSVIVPIFNEEMVINKFVAQLRPVIEELSKNQECSVLFVNNGSSDSSLELLRELKSSLPNYGILSLARNFGYETALIAGLSHSKSDYYALCDGDGEDPLELLLKFQKSILGGREIAIGIRKNRVEGSIT